MTKLLADSTLDAAANDVATATVFHICSGDPADRAGAISASLATGTPTFTGPVNGDTSGRKITIDAKSGITIDVSGTAAHFCLIDATELLLKTPTNSVVLTAGGGNTVSFSAFDVEFADPT